MKVLACLLTILIFSSCRSNSSDELAISFSDSVAIRFTLPGYSDSLLKQVTTNDKNAIKTIVNFIAGKDDVEAATCGYNGRLLFYNGRQEIKSIQFNYAKDECGQFIFKKDDKWITKKMSNEAADFFHALEKGQKGF